MFLRAHKSGNHTYLRLVESYRLHGQPRQRVVAHLGRKDLLAPHLDSLVRLLQADQEAPRWVASEQVAAPQAWSWGPLRAARHLFDELALGPILDGLSATRRHGQPLSERVFVLLANRLTRPGSEHALAQWLEDFYVVTAAGSRWRPQWKQSRRVKVACEQLRLWYQTLDDLLAHKASALGLLLSRALSSSLDAVVGLPRHLPVRRLGLAGNPVGASRDVSQCDDLPASGDPA